MPRPDATGRSTNHGGVAAVVTGSLKCKVINPASEPSTFESLCFTVTGSGDTIAVLLVYRPRSKPVTDAFFDELTSYLEVLSLYNCQTVVTGNFNICIERTDDAHSERLRNIIRSFGCVQNEPLVPTQRGGGTLDLLITKSEQCITELFVDPPSIISDHSLICWCVPFAHQPPIVETRDVRCWKKVSRDEFRSALVSSNLSDPSACPDTCGQCFDIYHQALQSLADKFARMRHVTMRCQLIAAWMDHECHVLRCHSVTLGCLNVATVERSCSRTASILWVTH